jgi:hypothetical protein
MYAREIEAPIDTPVQNGKPVAGTWARSFKQTNLMDIAHPFSLPLPRWAIKTRIKEWQSFIIQNNDVYFEAFMVNLRYFRFIEATIIDKKSGEPVRYIDYFPFSFWELPLSLRDGFVSGRAPGYFVAINNRLEDSSLTLDLNMESGGGLPSLNTIFKFEADYKKYTPMSVNMLFSEDRCFYTFKTLCPVYGRIILGENKIFDLDSSNTAGIFRDAKGFFPYWTRASWATAVTFLKDGRCAGFSLGENQAKGANKDNENALWINGSLTPLPPVRITQGAENEWVIDDIEGMIDLVFTPKKPLEKLGFNLIFAKADLYNPTGLFNGFVISKDGEKIEFHNVYGCAEKLNLRL